ncbi:DUF4309 domain-containing protein [Pseudalkalibacillus sp. R45]|uniref:DUF4309 domain-containing protein n=1 Tax=Pseudalkalibacillus sp. R45 TaxID=3457433 RepID=UPI003FCCE94C
MKLVRRSFTVLTITFLLLMGTALGTAASGSPQSSPDLLIRQIMGLAYESQQTINSVPFGVGDSLRKVKKAWGEPDELSSAAAIYWDHHILFLYDNSTGRKTITAIEDFDPTLETIHLSELKNLIGEPESEEEKEGMYYVTYTDHENYEIEFVFESAWVDPNPKLNRYIVTESED